MTATLTRDEQADAVLRIVRELREQGWAKATVRVTRTGAVDVEVSAEGDKVARPQFSSGRGR